MGEAGEARIVGDHADGRAALVEFFQEIHHLLAVLGVEIAGGFVGQKNGWATGQGPSDRDTLLLATGELGGIVPFAVAHADALQCFADGLLALGGGHVPVG